MDESLQEHIDISWLFVFQMSRLTNRTKSHVSIFKYVTLVVSEHTHIEGMFAVETAQG